jgi:hypothetical protein
MSQVNGESVTRSDPEQQQQINSLIGAVTQLQQAVVHIADMVGGNEPPAEPPAPPMPGPPPGPPTGPPTGPPPAAPAMPPPSPDQSMT